MKKMLQNLNEIFFSIYIQFRGCADSIRTTFGLDDASLTYALHWVILHFRSHFYEDAWN